VNGYKFNLCEMHPVALPMIVLRKLKEIKSNCWLRLQVICVYIHCVYYMSVSNRLDTICFAFVSFVLHTLELILFATGI
jgi:hypothetical protein